MTWRPTQWSSTWDVQEPVLGALYLKIRFPDMKYGFLCECVRIHTDNSYIGNRVLGVRALEDVWDDVDKYYIKKGLVYSAGVTSFRLVPHTSLPILETILKG